MIRTRDLYEAHLHLNREDNIVGQGEAFNYLRKHFSEIIKNLKLK